MNAFQIGFNAATQNGPLCEEPMQGVCFIIDNIEIIKEEETEAKGEINTKVSANTEVGGPFTG